MFVCASGLLGGAVSLLAKWLYAHPSNSAVGSTLSVMADFVPMAIATVGIIMSYRTPKKEHHLRTTLILVVCGFVGTGILSLARIRSEAAYKLEMDGLNGILQSVGLQNTHILTSLTAGKTTNHCCPANDLRPADKPFFLRELHGNLACRDLNGNWS
jgi:TctA family transporter